MTEHISRLRRKIEIDPELPSRIVTSRGVGYRLEPAPHLEEVDRRDNAGDATIVIVAEKIISATPEAIVLLRAEDESDITGRDVMDFVAADSKATIVNRRSRMRSGVWPRPELITIRRCDGTELPVELASTVVFTRNGVQAVQVTVWDLTRDGARFQELATGIHTDSADAVIVTDREARIRSFNSAAEDFYGWRADEIIGSSILDTIFAGDRKEIEVASGLALRTGVWHGVVEHRRRDGSTIAVNSTLTAIRGGGDQPIGFVAVNRPATTNADDVSAPPRPNSPLADEMRRAIELGELIVHYQPVVRLEDARWLGVEALTRWRHPDRGLLMPAEFAAAFDDPTVSAALGDTTLDTACRQAQTWRENRRDLHVAVNLSARQLTDRELPSRLEALLAATGLPAQSLWLEVTETALVQDLDVAARVTHAIDELGIGISIDDFGTGWASLTYLRQFPVRALKIDRSFVDALRHDRRANAIVRSVVALGAELDLAVVAEGVETDDQRERLLELGCVVGQGHLFGTAQSADDIDDRLAAAGPRRRSSTSGSS